MYRWSLGHQRCFTVLYTKRFEHGTFNIRKMRLYPDHVFNRLSFGLYSGFQKGHIIQDFRLKKNPFHLEQAECHNMLFEARLAKVHVR